MYCVRSLLQLLSGKLLNLTADFKAVTPLTWNIIANSSFHDGLNSSAFLKAAEAGTSDWDEDLPDDFLTSKGWLFQDFSAANGDIVLYF